MKARAGVHQEDTVNSALCACDPLGMEKVACAAFAGLRIGTAGVSGFGSGPGLQAPRPVRRTQQGRNSPPGGHPPIWQAMGRQGFFWALKTGQRAEKRRFDHTSDLCKCLAITAKIGRKVHRIDSAALRRGT